MPKKSNFKNPKPVEASASTLIIEKEKPISSSTKPKKTISEIDEIFAGKKRNKPENQEKTNGVAVKDPKKVKKSSRIPKDDVLTEVPRKPRKKTGDGFTVYTEEELGIGKSNAGEDNGDRI
ncbi:hypothetical protein K7X08_013879 [Anisodus acutangulus]|uniref:Uncharacterized protein n=1 Tax=Anisodus acutangulus TaxID=402998 RepID=A0A9Q1LL35_9SOLA|nr:hypothetical protein K7X08_013879 [Anisodus acutangulus]